MRELTADEARRVSGGFGTGDDEPIDEIIVRGQLPVYRDGHFRATMGVYDGSMPSYLTSPAQDAPEMLDEDSRGDPGIEQFTEEQVMDEIVVIGNLSDADKTELRSMLSAMQGVVAGSNDLNLAMGDDFTKLFNGLGLLGDIAEGTLIVSDLADGATLEEIGLALGFIAGVAAAAGVGAVSGSMILGAIAAAAAGFLVQEATVALVEAVIDRYNELADQVPDDYATNPAFWYYLFGGQGIFTLGLEDI
jgi:hypothetical protein